MLIATTEVWNPGCHLWDVASGGLVGTIPDESGRTFRSFAFSPATRSLLISVGTDKTLRFWNTSSCQEIRRLVAEDFWTDAFAISADGKLLAIADGTHCAFIIDVALGTVRHRLTGHSDVVRGLGFVDGSRAVVSWGEDNTLRYWDLVNGREGRKPHQLSAGYYHFLPSPQGNIAVALAWRSRRFDVVDLATGKVSNHCSLEEGERILGLSFSRDGRLLAISTVNEVQVWDTATWAEIPEARKRCLGEPCCSVFRRMVGAS
jgi:WD40 repeat protein